MAYRYPVWLWCDHCNARELVEIELQTACSGAAIGATIGAEPAMPKGWVVRWGTVLYTYSDGENHHTVGQPQARRLCPTCALLPDQAIMPTGHGNVTIAPRTPQDVNHGHPADDSV